MPSQLVPISRWSVAPQSFPFLSPNLQNNYWNDYHNKGEHSFRNIFLLCCVRVPSGGEGANTKNGTRVKTPRPQLSHALSLCPRPRPSIRNPAQRSMLASPLFNYGGWPPKTHRTHPNTTVYAHEYPKDFHLALARKALSTAVPEFALK